MSKQNILFFVCDDLRYNALGCMGDPVVKTPNLDRLAGDGVCFERCYIPGGSSGAVCMPSRAMLHTGRPVFHIHEEGQTIAPEHCMLGEYLQEQGYHVFHTGKWHNGTESLARAFNDGDEIFFGGMSDQWNMPVHPYDPEGRYDNYLPYVADPLHEGAVQYRHADHTSAGTHATTLFTDAARRFVKNRTDDAPPFFLSIALTAPHDPRNAPQEFHDLYPIEDIPLPENFLAQHPHNTGFMTSISYKHGHKMARDEGLAALPRDPQEVKQHIADYYAMTSHLDHEFGRLREALEEAGEWENTIVVFTADHGLSVGQHGLMGKQNIYDHSVRVPLLIAGPGIPKGKRPDGLVCHYDLYRTLCELGDLAIPESVQGESLQPVWSGQPGREELYLCYSGSIRGLVKDGYKLIEYALPGGYRATQLFHLDDDPAEAHDLVNHADQQDRIAAMRKRIVELSHETGDRENRQGVHFWETCDPQLA